MVAYYCISGKVCDVKMFENISCHLFYQVLKGTLLCKHQEKLCLWPGMRNANWNIKRRVPNKWKIMLTYFTVFHDINIKIHFIIWLIIWIQKKNNKNVSKTKKTFNMIEMTGISIILSSEILFFLFQKLMVYQMTVQGWHQIRLLLYTLLFLHNNKTGYNITIQKWLRYKLAVVSFCLIPWLYRYILVIATYCNIIIQFW